MRLELFYPVKPWVVNYGFGVNEAYYSQFGIKGHNGIDINTFRGQPVYAAHDGEVTYAGVDTDEGYGVVLRTLDQRDYDGGTAHMKTIYWHLLPNIQVKVGAKIKAGTLLGYADSTGISSGDHLHFALKPVAQGENYWSWENVEQNNGYKGAIDPAPYFNKCFAQDSQFVLNSLKSLINLLTLLISKLK